MLTVHIMDAKDAHRVHMDVMDAQCTHYGCYERNWSPREKCVCSHWDQGFVVTLPTHRAHTAVECWSHEARYQVDIQHLIQTFDWTVAFESKTRHSRQLYLLWKQKDNALLLQT